MTENVLGLFIARHREQAGTSQAALARSAGISRPYLTQIENGKRMPSDEVIQKLLAGLGVSMEEVVHELLPGQIPQEQLDSLARVVRGYDALAKYLTADQIIEVTNAMGSPEQLEASLRNLAGEPMPGGPDGWLELTKGDRRLVQQLVNRLLRREPKL